MKGIVTVITGADRAFEPFIRRFVLESFEACTIGLIRYPQIDIVLAGLAQGIVPVGHQVTLRDIAYTKASNFHFGERSDLCVVIPQVNCAKANLVNTATEVNEFIFLARREAKNVRGWQLFEEVEPYCLTSDYQCVFVGGALAPDA